MRLEAQSPARMGQAVAQRGGGVGLPGGAVHRLEEEVVEVEALEPLGLGAVLRDRPASARRPPCTTSGAPALGLTQSQSMPGGGGTVPLVSTATSNPSACSASSSGGVELQQRLAAGADDEAACPPGRPGARLRPRRARAPAGRRTCRRPGRRCRRSRCRRTGRWRPRGRLRGRSTGCTRRSGRTPPAGRCWRLRPAGCRRSP